MYGRSRGRYSGYSRGGGYIVRPFVGSYRGGRGQMRRGNNAATTTVIFQDGDHVDVPGPYGNQINMGSRNQRGNYRPKPIPPRGYRGGRRGGRVRSRSENNASSVGEDELASPSTTRNAVPSRPLTRVVARARARSLSAGKQQETSGGTGNNAPVSGGLPDRDAYRMEVNEYVTRTGGGGAGNQGSKTIPCVTVRDMHTFIPDRKQRRIWVPVAVCDELVKALKMCKTSDNGPYDVTKLKPAVFNCPVTKKVVEVEFVDEMVRLRTFMDVPSKEDYKDGDLIEVIELRNELMGRLIKFLDDVATRYRKISAQMTIPSLYSYSGERRFYYDLRETRWGLRLHISQVTDLHRNVIGIPLESVVDFRDRLNQVIDFLNLGDEKMSGLTTGRQRTASGRKKVKKGKQRKRSYSNKSKDKKSADDGEGKGGENEEKETTEDKVDGNVSSEKGAAGDLPQSDLQQEAS